MTLRAKASRLIFCTLAGLAFLAGCSQPSSLEVLSEEEDPIFRRARDLYARGMENEALENFLKLIQRRNGNAPESRLDAGNIYLDHLGDPVSAIYHFKHYVMLVSQSGRADADVLIERVRHRIKSAEKEFAESFDAKIFKDHLERIKLLDRIEDLRSENETLKQQLARARTRLSEPVVSRENSGGVVEPRRAEPVRSLRVDTSTRVPPARPELDRDGASGRRYVIKSGDSLYRIASEVYGNGGRWREILEANRDVIPDESSLKVGVEIRIP